MTSELRHIAWAGGDERLLTAAGLTLTLQGTGPELFNWAPKSKKALDLELRMQPIFGFDELEIPTWRYSFELAHADGIYRFPGPTPVTPLDGAILPHRGLLARLSAKELRVNVWFAGYLSGAPAPAQTQVQVSVQPAFGSTARPSIVYSESADPAGAMAKRFPTEATEWRVRQWDGRPLPIGLLQIFLLTISGPTVPGSPADGALFFDWQPIPPLALGWAATSPECIAEYR